MNWLSANIYYDEVVNIINMESEERNNYSYLKLNAQKEWRSKWTSVWIRKVMMQKKTNVAFKGNFSTSRTQRNAQTFLLYLFVIL